MPSSAGPGAADHRFYPAGVSIREHEFERADIGNEPALGPFEGRAGAGGFFSTGSKQARFDDDKVAAIRVKVRAALQVDSEEE